MTLEATMLVLDNSDWMRNSDYSPTRLKAQADAVNILFQVKQQSHPENTVGVMTMAGRGPDVLASLTSDAGKILNALHQTVAGGKANLSTGIQVAQLALKHRRNKTQRQRVIAFVGSPVEEEEEALVRLAKKLKKNNVAVDIISFGEVAQNNGKLASFINAVCSSDNSHLVSIPPGPHLLSDMLVSSPIVSSGEGPSVGRSGASGGDSFEFGVDPNLDPELALALRISLEEERARQAAATGAGESSGEASTADASAAALAPPADEDAEMEDLTEEEQIARAIEMSLDKEGGQDSDFVSSVLSGLHGVDPSDPRVQEALANNESKKDGEEGGEKEGDEKEGGEKEGEDKQS